MLKYFLRKRKKEKIFSPGDGEVKKIENIGDEVFSNKLVGDGFLFIPENNKIYSPIKGIVETVFPTLNGIMIKTDSNLGVLVHTTGENLDSKSFVIYVKDKDYVNDGDLLIEIKSQEKMEIEVAVIFDMKKVKNMKFNYGDYKKNDLIGKVNIR